ncbi:MAG: glycosyltransferase family 2 protein [Bdellovibrionota bacterium]
MVKYSFVIPAYNEEETIPELARRLKLLMDQLEGECEVLIVNDGSRDRTPELLLAVHRFDPRFKVIHLARNFGHQMAVTAGIDHASGEAAIIMDADLQDDPELVPALIERWKEGYEVVHAVRTRRRGETWFRRIAADLFYRMLNRYSEVELPAQAGDFRLVDRKALEVFKSLREHNRYVRGMFAWVGFRQCTVPFVRQQRFSGKSKYPLPKLIRLAFDGIVGFSDAPLRLSLRLGFSISALSFALGILAVALRLANLYVIRGWTSLILAIFFMGGVQLMMLGMMGEYIARIYREVQGRPLYVVQGLHGLGEQARQPRSGTMG